MKGSEMLSSLTIAPYLEKIADTLLSSPSRFLVLTAETAAGKSTAVPIAFLDRVPGNIVMLEPRRLATIAIAERISAMLETKVGEACGYSVHLDTRKSSGTRIEIITEAILTRRIQADPSLSGVSVVILDEFHERSVHTDLALALLREIISLRDDLFVLVMSATIDTERVSSWLSAPVMHIPGRRFPVRIEYETPRDVSGSRYPESLPERSSRAVKKWLAATEGSILAFLPGIRDISRTRELLADSGLEVLVLHSSVPIAEQRRVLGDPAAGSVPQKKRIILSSSIAETSLTVPGVTTVIDSGLSRIVRFHAQTGMDTLVTETESSFQAEQRAGRAGREGPGTCVRLWAPHDVRLSEMPCEITRTDILPLVLECALWGVSEPDGLEWLDKPSASSWKTARDLLFSMEALDADGIITDKGRLLARLGVHPRVGAVALDGEIGLAAEISSVSDDRREIERIAVDLRRRTGIPSQGGKGVMALLSGFPDRIAHRESNADGDAVYRFPSGRLASLPRESRTAAGRAPEWIVATDVDAGEREGKIYAFHPLDDQNAVDWLLSRSTTSAEISFIQAQSGKGEKPVKTVRTSYGKIALSERRADMDEADIRTAVCESIRKSGVSSLPWNDASRSFFARALYATRRTTGSGIVLLDSLEEWLVPFIPSNGSLGESPFFEALKYRFRDIQVDRDAPSRIALANGLSRPLVYEEITPGTGPEPVLETRVQDLYGCPTTPKVSGKNILLRLLSPARRPVQTTRDLEGFWKGSWQDVRKEMRGRYPKHHWPENPSLPDSFVKPREKN